MEELNLEDLWEYFKSKILVIVIGVFICLGLGILYTFVLQVPTYESSATMVLTMSSESETGITQNDLAINEKLVATYSEFMKSKRVINQVIDNLDLKDSYEEVADYVSVRNQEDTELIRISVIHEDEKLATDLANEIADVFMEEIVSYYDIENIKVVDYADDADEPSNVNVPIQIVVSIFIGLLVTSLLVFGLYYIDNTVRTVEEVERKTGLTIIGLIPMKKGSKK